MSSKESRAMNKKSSRFKACPEPSEGSFLPLVIDPSMLRVREARTWDLERGTLNREARASTITIQRTVSAKARSLLFVAAIILLALPASSLAQRKTLRVSYPAPATVYLPLWIASEAGLFSKHGLDVELVHVGSSPIAMAAYLAGEIDILGGGGSAGPNAYLRGQRDLVFFGAMNNKFVFSIYAHPSVSTVAGVRSKRIGVTRFGGTMDFATRHFLRQNGFDPGREVTMVQVGRVQDILSDMRVLAQTYDYHSRVIWPRVPEILPEDLKLVLEELAEANPKAREIDPAELIYGSIVKDVIASGFVEKLYAR